MVFRSFPIPEASRNSTSSNSVMASSTTVKPHHQPLHNFPLQDLKWSINNSSPTNQNHPRVRKPDHKKSAGSGSDDVAAEQKGKIFIRLKASNNNSKSGDDVAMKNSDDVEDEFLEAKTWNLRPRKTAGSKPGSTRTEGTRVESTQNELTRARNAGDLKAICVEKKKEEKKQKFSISLSKEEIEEDVFALTGSKPVRRPKKRPRHVQKALDCVFPGLWLASITPDSYRVDPLTKG